MLINIIHIRIEWNECHLQDEHIFQISLTSFALEIVDELGTAGIEIDRERVFLFPGILSNISTVRSRVETLKIQIHEEFIVPDISEKFERFPSINYSYLGVNKSIEISVKLDIDCHHSLAALNFNVVNMGRVFEVIIIWFDSIAGTCIGIAGRSFWRIEKQ